MVDKAISMRLQELLSALLMTQKQFAQKTNLSESTVSKWISADRPFNEKAASKLKPFLPGVNFDYILYGKGNLLLTKSPLSTVQEDDSVYVSRSEELREIVVQLRIIRGALHDLESRLDAMIHPIEVVIDSE